MEFNGNTLKIKNKIYAINNIKYVDYSVDTNTARPISISAMLLLLPLIYFYSNIYMILIYVLLIILSFVKIKQYNIFIDDNKKPAFTTMDEDIFLGYKKELIYHMQNKQDNTVEFSTDIKDSKSIESVEEYKLKKRKEAFAKNLEEQEAIYKKKYEESKNEIINTTEAEDTKESKPIMSNKDKKEKGDDYEKKVAGYYKLDGYDIYLNGIKKNRLDGGIDVICKKDDEIVLIQCKNWDYTTGRKITHKNIKEFHSNCIKYIEQNDFKKENVKLKYIVPNKKVFKSCAIEIFRDNYYNCKYEILEF